MTEQTKELASLGKRLGGALLDGLIYMAITIPAMLITGVWEQSTRGQQMTIGQRVFFFFFGFAVLLIINGYLLAKHGQTVGKRIVGTRIVSYKDGQILSLGRILGLRYLPIGLVGQIPVIGPLFSLVDILFIFRKDRRCVHDLIAGSKVVDA